jgi:hypothetical protein
VHAYDARQAKKAAARTMGPRQPPTAVLRPPP